MFTMIKSAIVDRKAVTALEYALIASALAAVTLAGFKTFFTTVNSTIQGIAFS